MLFDLFDYSLGLIKNIVYFLVYHGNYMFKTMSKFSSKAQIRIYNQGKIKISSNTVVRSGCILRVHNTGTIILGKGSGLNNNCLLTAFDSIEIGENTILGQGVKIYDHDHIYKRVENIRRSGFETKKVTIGNNVWIGSDCIILKGTVIGDNCVIAAGSIVNGEITNGTLFMQKRSKSVVSLDD